MKYKYMRIQGRENSYVTGYPKGVFSLCWRLINDGKMEEADAEEFRKMVDWFKAELPEPEGCRNAEKMITFFKVETTEVMRHKIETALKLIEKYNVPYDVVYTNFVGRILYEDNWQVGVAVENGKMV